MADIFDTLKKQEDRVANSASKPKKINREKTRPWHDYTVTVTDTSLDEQKGPLKRASSNANNDKHELLKTDYSEPANADQIRKQIVNNTETSVYVNKNDYVNNTETNINNDVEITAVFEKKDDNTETNIYVNKNDYVNNTETNSGPEISITPLITTKEDSIINNTETSVYVNKNDYVNNTETNDYVNNAETIRKQYVNKPETIRKQQGNYTQTTSKQSDISTTLNTVTNTETVRKQIKPAELVYSLPRSEEKILNFIVELCLNSASLTTPKLTYRLISSATQMTEKTCKTLIGRLKDKKIMHLESYTKGPGSYSIFSISQEVYNSYLYISGKSVLFDMRKQNVNKAETQSTLITETSASSKLVSNLNNTNNTIKNKFYDFNTEDLDLNELRLLGISGKAVGDSIRNLTKFLESNPHINPLTKEDFQDFINKFIEYANSPHGKSMKSKTAIFIHEIQNFQKEGTCATIDWSNDKDLEHYEQFVKEQEDRARRKNEMLEKAIDYSFLQWRDDQTKEVLLSLVPEGQFSKYGNPGYELELKKYFRDHIWETKKSQI